MRISVVIPVHNGASTLASCLEAACGQEYPDYEVIVVDDASTDSSSAIAAGFPCRVVSLPTNQGAAQAKNAGATEATGEVVFFTDADVLLPPNALALVAERLADPGVDGVVGLLGPHVRHADLGSQFKNLWMHYTYRRQPEEVGLFFTSAAAMRRPAFLAEGGFDRRYRGASVAEDIEFGQRARSNGRRIVLDQRLTVEHLKRYTLGEVLRTDVERARALALIWLRNTLGRTGRRHYASVPLTFGLSVPLAGLGTLGLAGLPWARGWGLGLAGLAYGLILALNGRFLAFLARARGWRFGLQCALFLPLDLVASGLGVAAAMVDAARGRWH